MEAKGLCGNIKSMAYIAICLGMYLFANFVYYASQKIKNPNYSGKWKAPLIDNPGSIFILVFTLDVFM